ncbi:MAG: replicative DNA helicase [Candidatus Saccharibacteria bacterium]|nr:replicative DNA helicase [Candidatus Saccharibacteria bacterium]
MPNEKPVERITPQNLDAEKSLLGAILISENSLPDVTEIVKPQDFYDERNQHIFNAMWNLYEHHRPVDLLTVKTELKEKNLTKKAGGASYLAELSSYVPTAAHATAYADLVKKAAIRRNLINAAAKINEAAYNESTETQEVLSEAEKLVFNVSDQNTRTDAEFIGDLLSSTFDRLEQLYENKGSIAGYKTGFPDLDKKTAGFHKSDLIILAARPAMGKTALALNFARNVAAINKKAVLIFSLEMGKEQLINRMLADASGVSSFNLETGNFNSEDFAKISEAMSELEQEQIFIDDKPGLSIMEMRTKARRIAHDHDLGMIIVDYLQLMSGTSKQAQGNRVQEISEISRGLKMIARELNVPVISLSQLSRTVEQRDVKIPMLSDLRESGSIEQDADIVMFLYREDYYNEETDRQNIADLILAKHRRGATGKVEFYFDKERVRFMSLDTKHEQ